MSYEEVINQSVVESRMDGYLSNQLAAMGAIVYEVSYYLEPLYIDGYNQPPVEVPGADFCIELLPGADDIRDIADVIAGFYDLEQRDLNGIGRNRYKAEYNDYEEVIPREF